MDDGPNVVPSSSAQDRRPLHSRVGSLRLRRPVGPVLRVRVISARAGAWTARQSLRNADRAPRADWACRRVTSDCRMARFGFGFVRDRAWKLKLRVLRVPLTATASPGSSLALPREGRATPDFRATVNDYSRSTSCCRRSWPRSEFSSPPLERLRSLSPPSRPPERSRSGFCCCCCRCLSS